MKSKLTKKAIDYAINRVHSKSGKSYSTAFGVLEEHAADISPELNSENVKSYDSIPGPKKLPIIGNGWRFAPLIGQYSIQELDKVMWSLYKDYGKIVRVSGLFGHPDLLFVFDGDIIKTIFKAEEEMPHRPSMPSLHYYKQRLKKDFFGESPGAVGVHGPLWDEFRRNVQQVVLQPSVARKYYEPLDQIATEFINRIDTYLLNEHNELPANFMSELNKWALESVARVSLDARLGCLKPNLSQNSESKKIITSILTFFKNVPEVELRFPIWRLYHNKHFRDYIAALETFRILCVKHINMALEKDNDEKNMSIVKRIVERTGSARLATVLALDFFLVGVDTTSITIASTMYHLSQNQEKQSKLYEELKMTIAHINEPVNLGSDLSYLKACVRETLRLKPVVLGNGRSLQSERIIDGYLVPKGTHVIFPHLVVGNLEKYFSEPERFIPERWLKGNKDGANKFHPFVSLPFGYGRRACLGKRFAEAELYILLAKIFRRYKVEYNYGKMTYKVVPTYMPINPLKFKLTRRE